MFKFMQHQSPLTIALQTLNVVLSLKRPHGGSGVAKAVKYLRKQHPQATVDDCGNVHIDLRGDTVGELQQEKKHQTSASAHKTLFVAHLDTVHRKDGVNRFQVEGDKLLAKGAPLGADDGAGIAILMALLHAKVPAYYVFTQGEEVGGVGAKYLRRHSPALLAQFDRAVAFDRRSTISVISHQGMGRCCSDVFATALSDGLNGLGMMMLPDDSGIYTDTAEWTDIISECTNVSCGYFNEHSKDEWLDLNHFNDLVNAVVQLDWDSLPVARDPRKIELNESWWWSRGRNFDASSYRAMLGLDCWDGLTDNLGAEAEPHFDERCYRVMQAIEAAEEGDDFCLKQMMVDAVDSHKRSLISEMLYPQPISSDALEFGFETLGFLETREVLLGMLELTDSSLV